MDLNYLTPHREQISKWLTYEVNEWLKEVRPGETDRNSEIAFHAGELLKLIDKLQPQTKSEIKAPSMR
jgi:hypothetical protein